MNDTNNNNTYRNNKFSRRHYYAIIKLLPIHHKFSTIKDLIYVFERDNPAFSAEYFLNDYYGHDSKKGDK